MNNPSMMNSEKLLAAAASGSTIRTISVLASNGEQDEEEVGVDDELFGIAGQNKSAVTKGYTPLMKAANAGHLEVVEVLLAALQEQERAAAAAGGGGGGGAAAAAGAALDARKTELFRRDRRGRTALDWARIGRKTKVAARLEREMYEVIEAERRLVAASANAARCKATVDRNGRAAASLRAAVDERDLARVGAVLRGLTFTRAQFEAAWRAHLAVRRAGGGGGGGGAGGGGGEGGGGAERPETEADGGGDGGPTGATAPSFEEEVAPFCLDLETPAGVTPLHLACAAGAVELARDLVLAGADPNRETRQGHTALTWACACGHPAVVEALVDKGAELRRPTRKEDWTALMHAAYNGQDACCMVLVDKLTDRCLDAKTDDAHRAGAGQAPAPTGGGGGGVEAISPSSGDWLAELGRYLAHRDRLGQDALGLARMRRHRGAAHVLELAHARCIERARRQAEEEARRKNIIHCHLGCGYKAQVELVELHEINDCKFRPVGCADCGAYDVKKFEVEDHLANHCPKRTVLCPHASRGCQADLAAEDLDTHLLHKCQYHVAPCRLGCGRRVLRRDRTAHEDGDCPKNRVDCPNRCGAAFLREETDAHLKNACPLRLVPCTVSCGAKVAARDLEHHEQEVCVRPCHWDGCGQRVGPKALRELHQASLCPWRVVACRHGCGTPALPARRRARHARLQCPRRPEPCALGCGATLPREEMAGHTEAEGGACPHRPRRCRLDFLGRRVLVTSAKDKQIKATIKQYSEEKDEFRIIYPDGSKWEKLSSLIYTILDDDDWECSWVPDVHMSRHINHECPLRLVSCGLGCGQKIQDRLHDKHVKDHCQKRKTKCDLCEAEVEASFFFQHQTEICPKREVECGSCGHSIRADKVQFHEKEECPERRVRCPLGCGLLVRHRLAAAHAGGDCPKRPVACPHCETADLWAEELGAHLEEGCPARAVACPAGCGATPAARDARRHAQEECPEREEECRCGKAVRWKDREDHRISECTAVERYCSYGCGAKLALHDMEEHQAQLCPRKNIGHAAIVECSLGCGKMVARTEEFEHVTTTCMYRQVECPLGCGLVLRADNLGHHTLTCDHRQVPCGADAPFCARQLRSWIYTHEGRPHLLACDEHGSTPLVWAAAKADRRLAAHLLATCAETLQVDHEDQFGESALTRACYGNHMDLITLLVQKGARVNQCTHAGYTPLIQAVRGNGLAAVNYLIKERAVLTFAGRNQMTAFDWAGQLRLQDILKSLRRAHKVQRDLQAVFVAVARGDRAAVKRLVDQGEPYRLNHVASLEAEMAQLENDVKVQEDKAKELEEDGAQYPASIARLEDRRARVEAEHDALVAGADAVGLRARRAAAEVQRQYQAAVRGFGGLEPGDVLELERLRQPPEDVFQAVKATCLLMDLRPSEGGRTPRGGAAAAAAAAAAARGDRPGPDGFTRAQWWRRGQQMLRDPNFLHRVRHYNKAAVPEAAVARLRDEILAPGLLLAEGVEEDDEGGAYALAEALKAWVRAVAAHAAAEEGVQASRAEERRLRGRAADLAPGLGRLRTDLRLERFRLGLAQGETGGARREIAQLRAKAALMEDRVRVAKLCAVVTPSGHTALSWAAACGQPEIVRLLLYNGATYGYGDEHAVCCAKILQLVWRHHRWRRREAKAARAGNPDFDPRARKQRTQRLAAHTLALGALLGAARRQRRTRRRPLVEAAYAGHWEVVGVFQEFSGDPQLWDLLRSRCLPLRPPPYAYDNDVEGDGQLAEPLDLLAAAEMGKAAGGGRHWIHGEGWINKDNPENRWAKCVEKSRRFWREVCKLRDFLLTAKEKRKVMEEQRRKKARLSKELELAILASDFYSVIRLFEEGAAVDHEAGDGCTALIKAANEDPESVGHAQLVNADGDKVLAVELLLDRRRCRPTLERESRRLRHTALSWAAYHNRVAAVEALLARGAALDRPNADGLTPLMWAARNGKPDVVRLLLENGADPGRRDARGRDALDWAKAGNFTGAIVELSREGRGDKGPVKVARGTAAVLVPCHFGCGQTMRREDFVEHDEVCTHRRVRCANGCDVPELLFHEQHEHETVHCMHRLVPCPLLCQPPKGEVVERGQVARLVRKSAVGRHVAEECPNRKVACADCGQEVVARHMARHLKIECPERRTECTLGCSMFVRVEGLKDHLKHECPLRTVRCRLNCGSDMFAQVLEEHETHLCLMRRVQCKWRCSEPLRARHQADHEAKQCPQRKVRCPARCAQKVRHHALGDHLARLCPHRFIECPMGCTMKIRHVDIKDHVNIQCAARLVPCTLECGENIKLSDMNEHTKKHCSRRLIPCANCLDPIESEMLENHKKYECRMRTVQCSNTGCYKRLPLAMMEKHEKFECRRRIVYCLQGCGEDMYAEKRKVHHENYCEFRYIPCPLGCGEKIREKDKWEHMDEVCVRRHIA